MTIKETFEKITDKLIAQIKKSGVPSEFIVRDWGNRFVLADVVIMSEHYQTPVAVFEVKISENENSVESGIRNLRRIAAKLKITAPCYLACGKADGGIEIFNVSQFVYTQESFDYKAFGESCLIEKLPDFLNLQNDLPSKNNAVIEGEKQQYEKIFQRLCFWIIPGYCIIFLILDALEIFKITYERLIVLGVIIIIPMLPFVSELSMAGLHLKLRNKTGKDKK